jgi:hypothetical protein
LLLQFHNVEQQVLQLIPDALSTIRDALSSSPRGGGSVITQSDMGLHEHAPLI